jgi:hypothetical protein
VYKHKFNDSEGERDVQRSIFVSSTGSKTIKRESAAAVHTSNDPLGQRSRVSNKQHWTLGCKGCIKVQVDEDMEHDPVTQQLTRRGGPPVKFVCKILKADGTPCGRPFKRQEHLHRYVKTHSGIRYHVCAVPGCTTDPFDRRDNCCERYCTHVHYSDQKGGRNRKKSLRYVLSYAPGPTLVEKLYGKWKNATHFDYRPEDDPDVEDEEELAPVGVVK